MEHCVALLILLVHRELYVECIKLTLLSQTGTCECLMNYTTDETLIGTVGLINLHKIYIHILYSGKFSNSANFRIIQKCIYQVCEYKTLQKLFYMFLQEASP